MKSYIICPDLNSFVFNAGNAIPNVVSVARAAFFANFDDIHIVTLPEYMPLVCKLFDKSMHVSLISMGNDRWQQSIVDEAALISMGNVSVAIGEFKNRPSPYQEMSLFRKGNAIFAAIVTPRQYNVVRNSDVFYHGLQNLGEL